MSNKRQGFINKKVIIEDTKYKCEAVVQGAYSREDKGTFMKDGQFTRNAFQCSRVQRSESNLE